MNAILARARWGANPVELHEAHESLGLDFLELERTEPGVPHPDKPTDGSEAPTQVGARSGSGPASPLEPGHRLGRYLVEDEVGRGGMGVVWRAVDERLGRRVALKTMGDRLATQTGGLPRFEREARLLAGLNHSNIATVHDLVLRAGSPVLVMELLEGENLASRLSKGRLGLQETLRVGVQVAAALEAAHGQGIVHRDLKPANIQLLPSGVVKVVDFGLALAWADDAPPPERIEGTPGYMSPEQARGEAVDFRSDLFSLGLVLHDCLLGHLVEVGEGAYPSVHWPLEDATPQSVRDLVEACLSGRPDQRPADASTVHAVLLSELAGEQSVPSVVHRRSFVPHERDVFVGRELELRDLASSFDEGARLLTLLGPGGVGKTRLAIRHAHDVREGLVGGAWFCDLSEARDLEGITRAVAAALDLRLGSGDGCDQLGHALARRGPCLVILDNFEQVSAQAEDTLGRWLDRASEARFLVTSRVLLGVTGERIVPVEPLPIAEGGVELFVSRAAAMRPGFALTDENRDDVATIVELLDGLPLAIELAAARTRVLGPRQVAERLKSRLSFLSGQSGARAQQATLRDAFDWSWDLLRPWERAALAQCSVFEGRFPLTAAEEVVDLTAWTEAPAVLDVVQSLVDQSLLRSWSSEAFEAAPQFGWLVSLREHAMEKLSDPSSMDDGVGGPSAREAALLRHGRHHAGLGDERLLESLEHEASLARRRELVSRLDDLVIACRRALKRGDADTAVATHAAASLAFRMVGSVEAALRLGERVVALPGLAGAGRGRTLELLAIALNLNGKALDARPLLAESLDLARDLGDRRAESRRLRHLGHAEQLVGRPVEARAFFEEAIAVARAEDEDLLEAAALERLGSLDMNQGFGDRARRSLEAALVIARRRGERRFEASVLTNLAGVTGYEDRVLARELYLEALRILDEEDDRLRHVAVLGNLAGMAAADGRPEEAEDFLKRGLDLARDCGMRRFEGKLLLAASGQALVQARFDEARECLSEALAIAGEVGDRMLTGEVWHRRAATFEQEGRVEEALVDYDRALLFHREVGNRLAEGVVLVHVGDLSGRLDRLDDAFEAFAAGEEILRELDNRAQLGVLLAARGRHLAFGGRPEQAREHLREAEAIEDVLQGGPSSELGGFLRRLREALEPEPPA
ncbi:MAG: tetratricopeptide repeat protein [Acidobacteriota bacterium]